ncbi:MAG: DUF5658 family protein [Chloroflexi bacterium]|nr:DUF5658 family protein [Chloroflexota bacterium]MDA1218784.1 DUF5658 family protein [Chloroflexota bacterium]PKB57216.1 MAG: hypothetical protein BZY73_04510 [SAR202 cluster bacterium Casp-Chloro-G3]
MKAFILANISDVISTIFGLNLGGIEANPIINFLMEATSVPEALLVKLAVAAGVGLLISRWKPRVLSALTLVFSLIAISNSLVGLGYL